MTYVDFCVCVRTFKKRVTRFPLVLDFENNAIKSNDFPNKTLKNYA